MGQRADGDFDLLHERQSDGVARKSQLEKA